MRGAALVTSLALTSCASESAVWHADERFTEDERASVVRGALWLEAASARDVGAVAFDYRVTSAQPLGRTIRREPPPAGDGGFCSGGVGGTVYLSTPNAYLDGLAAHELAHCALGMTDDPQTDGIMRVLHPMRWTERESAQVD